MFLHIVSGTYCCRPSHAGGAAVNAFSAQALYDDNYRETTFNIPREVLSITAVNSLGVRYFIKVLTGLHFKVSIALELAPNSSGRF
jgi:hypothetical protein